MMLNNLDTFYISQPEPNQSIMLALRHFILSFSFEMTEHWKWKLPFFYFKNKAFCYIWKDAKTQQVYVGFVKADRINHPLLVKGNRKKMKVLYIENSSNIPIHSLTEIFNLLIPYYI